MVLFCTRVTPLTCALHGAGSGGKLGDREAAAMAASLTALTTLTTLDIRHPTTTTTGITGLPPPPPSPHSLLLIFEPFKVRRNLKIKTSLLGS